MDTAFLSEYLKWMLVVFTVGGLLSWAIRITVFAGESTPRCLNLVRRWLKMEEEDYEDWFSSSAAILVAVVVFLLGVGIVISLLGSVNTIWSSIFD